MMSTFLFSGLASVKKKNSYKCTNSLSFVLIDYLVTAAANRTQDDPS